MTWRLEMNYITKKSYPVNKNILKKLLFSLGILFILVFIFLIFFNAQWQKKKPVGYIHAIEYIEDAQGALEFEDIKEGSKDSVKGFSWNLASDLMKGDSTSTWWVRIKTDNLLQYNKQGIENLFFSITNPTVEKVEFYVPISLVGGQGYHTYYAGWGYSRDLHEDQGFLYPVFKLPDNIQKGQFIYLRLNSSYTNNYTFRVMDEVTFNHTWNDNIAINSVFFGFIVAFGINNFIQFSTLKIRAQIYYIIYLSTILLYQWTVFGYVHIVFKSIGSLMIANVAAIGLLMMIAALLFLHSSLGTKELFHFQHKVAKVLAFLSIVDIIAIFIGYKYFGNIIAIILANFIGIFLISTTYLAMQKGISYAKYLFAGWTFTLFVSMIFNARAFGLIPNNEFTLFIILIPIIIEAILLSLGLAGLVKKLDMEKEDALGLYHIAELQATSKEAAFLQAQIKPHFLYNALNIIEALCYIDGRKAGELILDLSTFLQHSFDFRNLQKHIPFDEELEFVKAYVRIEQTRFRDNLNVIYDIDDAEELMLPPLLIQPLIENAIKHGIRKQGTKGTVSLRVKNMPEHYIIEIADDGIGMTEEKIKEILYDNKAQPVGVGVSNIQKRLKMFYNTELIYESKLGVGTLVYVVLPKKEVIN